jgi:membrane protein implicated in regulation of membrane protease activity
VRRLARLDLALGVLGAIVLLLATPGLAVSSLIALFVLALCALSVVLERRRRRRAERPAQRRAAPRGSAGGESRPRGGSGRDRRRSGR